MHSTMQDIPLQISRILEHGSTVHANSLAVTAASPAPRSTAYAAVGANAARLAGALRALGVRDGDRVATFMWNNQQHLEAYFGVPGMGAVLHPLNIRLAPEQISYIANHAEDRVVIVDDSLLPVFATLLPTLPAVEHVVINGTAAASLPGAEVSVPVHDYAQLIMAQPATFRWPAIDERAAAAMCYTSGTTGRPRGVVYSHRSIYLHALNSALPGMFNISEADQILVLVPQFHVLAWGLPYAAFLTGASLVMPDRFLAPGRLASLIAYAKPSKGAGVPTIWQGLLHYLDGNPDADISSLKEAIVGGSACPPSLMEAYRSRYGISLLHAWGMTEMSPLGTVARPPAHAGEDDAPTYRLTQGRFPATVQPRLVGRDGEVLPFDGSSIGEVQVRGPWITDGYYRDAEPAGAPDGWLSTGDIGFITADCYLTLVDRAKDVIKSGGEWISSLDLENHLMSHPAVFEAAVVGVPDDTWGERPLAVVVLRASDTVTDAADLRRFLAERIPRWQLPERWVFAGDLPKTSVGKFDKKAIRRQYADGELIPQFLR